MGPNSTNGGNQSISSFGVDDSNYYQNTIPNSYKKNKSLSDKKSRSGVSLGICKNGGGGKFTWGKPGIEWTRDCPDGTDDFNDPNFDEFEEDENTVYDIYDVDCDGEILSYNNGRRGSGSAISDEAIKNEIFGPFREYLVNSDPSELFSIFEELGGSKNNTERVYFHLLLWGLEAKKTLRGHIFVLIADIIDYFRKQEVVKEKAEDENPTPINSGDQPRQATKSIIKINNQFSDSIHLHKALEDFFDARVELIIDHPDYDEYVQKMLGSFLYEFGSVDKNSEIDEFLKLQMELRARTFSKVVQVSYSITARIKSHKSIMSTIWIMDDYLTPEQLSYELSKLVDDWAYAGFSAKCLVDDIRRGVNTPHYYHELVKQLLIKSVSVGRDEGLNGCCETIKVLVKSDIVESNQVKQGFLRVFNDIDELKIDIPRCTTLLAQIIQIASTMNIIDDEVRVKLPKTRGDRRRIISEMCT